MEKLEYLEKKSKEINDQDYMYIQITPIIESIIKGLADDKLDYMKQVTSNCMSLSEIIDESTFAIPQPDIPSLKKRIKYCKNPMEKKKLQQELNTLYKEQKRRK